MNQQTNMVQTLPWRPFQSHHKLLCQRRCKLPPKENALPEYFLILFVWDRESETSYQSFPSNCSCLTYSSLYFWYCSLKVECPSLPPCHSVEVNSVSWRWERPSIWPRWSLNERNPEGISSVTFLLVFKDLTNLRTLETINKCDIQVFYSNTEIFNRSIDTGKITSGGTRKQNLSNCTCHHSMIDAGIIPNVSIETRAWNQACVVLNSLICYTYLALGSTDAEFLKKRHICIYA